MDEITDIVRDDENHPLANLMDVLGVLIENYKAENVPLPEADPRAVLKYSMKENNLKQKDLFELGTQGVVCEILNVKRELNILQIQALSERFQVPSSVFVKNLFKGSSTPRQPDQGFRPGKPALQADQVIFRKRLLAIPSRLVTHTVRGLKKTGFIIGLWQKIY